MMAPVDDMKIDQAAEAGETFSKLYYESFDKKRHSVQKLYMDSASVVWNGHSVKGLDNILKFFESLPASEHTLDGLDCQPLTEQMGSGSLTIIIKVFGTVKYHDKQKHVFHQNFMLTSQNNVWKIVSDSFRFQD